MAIEPGPGGLPEPAAALSRRRLYILATNIVGALMAFLLAVPGVAYLLTPLRKQESSGDFRPLPVTLEELPVGVARQFPIVDERTDAWVKYPPEPIGAVWLIRQPEGSAEKVLALTAECPHLGCAVNLAADGQSFFCPCHASAFELDGSRLNQTPPRSMDSLQVEVSDDPSAPIRVKFERFRTQSEEKIPLV